MRSFLFLYTLFVVAIAFASGASITNTKVTNITPKNCNTNDISATYTKWKKIIKAVSKVKWDTSDTTTSTKKPNASVSPVTTIHHKHKSRAIPEIQGQESQANTKRQVTTTNTYTTIFDGTGNLTDAAVQMPAYLTYKVVSNTTAYATSQAACLSFCDATPGCASVNMYYEFNNALLDWVFSEKSNLKCVLYGDIPVLSQKTNSGGHQLEPLPHPLSRIENSSAYGNLNFFSSVATPVGYQLAFGPTTGANTAPGYMASQLITQYSPAACAALCAAQPADPSGGPCTYFNIWRSLVNGAPTTYTCSMYYLNTDSTTATYTGDSSKAITVSQSRGYVRGYALSNAGFEYGLSGWTINDTQIATTSTAHSGVKAAAMGTVGRLGSMTYTTSAIALSPGEHYTLTFWLANGQASSTAVFNVYWNGNLVFTKAGTSVQAYTSYSIVVPALASNDLTFTARQDPSYWYLDDIKITG